MARQVVRRAAWSCQHWTRLVLILTSWHSLRLHTRQVFLLVGLADVSNVRTKLTTHSWLRPPPVPSSVFLLRVLTDSYDCPVYLTCSYRQFNCCEFLQVMGTSPHCFVGTMLVFSSAWSRYWVCSLFRIDPSHLHRNSPDCTEGGSDVVF